MQSCCRNGENPECSELLKAHSMHIYRSQQMHSEGSAVRPVAMNFAQGSRVSPAARSVGDPFAPTRAGRPGESAMAMVPGMLC